MRCIECFVAIQRRTVERHGQKRAAKCFVLRSLQSRPTLLALAAEVH